MMKKMATRNSELLSNFYKFVMGFSATMGIVYMLAIVCEICHLVYGGW